MIDRRSFLKTAAAAALGLVAGGKGRQESVVEQVEPSGWVVFEGMGLDDLGPEAIAVLESILYLHMPTYWYDDDLFVEDESGVFPGLSHLITTGYLDAESKPCPPMNSII